MEIWKTLRVFHIPTPPATTANYFLTKRYTNIPRGTKDRSAHRKPLYSSKFVADYLRPAAIKAGVSIAEGQRFGLHNLRHSLSNWLVNKAKVEPKTVQGILRHSKIQTTLDLYTQEDGDETRAAQGAFLAAMGMKTEAIQ